MLKRFDIVLVGFLDLTVSWKASKRWKKHFTPMVSKYRLLEPALQMLAKASLIFAFFDLAIYSIAQTPIPLY
ncbi:MAG: hypothetical protein ACFFE8_06885 [Candidatus Heimdallarchaeota archaeon]